MTLDMQIFQQKKKNIRCVEAVLKEKKKQTNDFRSFSSYYNTEILKELLWIKS